MPKLVSARVIMHYATIYMCNHMNADVDIQRNDKDVSKPVAKHFTLPTYSMQHTAVSGLSLNLGTSESRKTLEQKFIFQIGTLIYIYKYTQTNKCQN